MHGHSHFLSQRSLGLTCIFVQFNKNNSRAIILIQLIIGNVHWVHSGHNHFAALFCIGEKRDFILLSRSVMNGIVNVKPAFHGACLERFWRRFCLRVFRSEQALLLKKNASTLNIAHVSMGVDCRAD